jgi:hypothetical protein
MKLNKDRFTVFDVKEDKLTNSDKLIISLVEGQTAKQLADYILECQKKADYWDELSTTIVLDDDIIETSIRTSEFKDENIRLKHIIESLKQKEKKEEK